MMKKIKIQYYKNLCIGQGNCATISPDYFRLLGKKAILKNSKNIGKDVYAIEVDCDETTTKSLIDARIACPVNAIQVIDVKKNKDIVSVDLKEDSVKEVIAEYDDKREFVIDDKGYFLIRVNREAKNIEVAFCNQKNNVALKVIGKTPIEIYQTIINKENIDIRKDHAAYLGRELQKAYLSLKYNLEYIQDDELELNKKAN